MRPVEVVQGSLTLDQTDCHDQRIIFTSEISLASEHQCRPYQPAGVDVEDPDSRSWSSRQRYASSNDGTISSKSQINNIL